jgi:hypothetical protein
MISLGSTWAQVEINFPVGIYQTPISLSRRVAAYYSFHYWLQFELAAYNALIVNRNLPRLVPV